jgi:hypothetical protein
MHLLRKVLMDDDDDDDFDKVSSSRFLELSALLLAKTLNGVVLFVSSLNGPNS